MPFVIAILTWCPYVVLNIGGHVQWPIWRVPFVPIVLFDSSAYFQWIGLALSGYPAGDHIGLFRWIIRALGFILPASLSIAEVWLLTLWMTVTLGVWMMAHAMQAWSDLPLARSRALACCAWVSLILPFMGRPGVYTWYVPFYAFALLGVWRVYERLSASKYVSAFLWTLVAFGAAWTYPFFLIHIALWLIVIWFLCLYQRFKRSVSMLGIAGIVSVPIVISFIAPLFLRSNIRLAFELKERLGLAFTRLPVVSNSLVLVFLWGILLVIAGYLFVEEACLQERAKTLLIGWIALAGSWLSNVFTGVYIHNDHFRGPAVFLAWLSLAFIYGVIQEAAKEGAREVFEKRSLNWLAVFLLRGVFVVSLGLFLWNTLGKGFVFAGDDLNIVHASHWLTLVVATLLPLVYTRKKTVRTVWIVTLVLSILLGFTARAALFWKEQQKFSSYLPYASTISWIHDHVPVHQDVCTDAHGGEIFGSFSGRMVHPSFAAIALPKPDEEIVKQLQTQLGYYDARAAQTEQLFLELLDSMRGTVCGQFSSWEKVARRLGRSEADVIAMKGCSADGGKRYRARIQEHLLFRKKDESAFRELCPVVIISRNQKAYWSLPQDYREIKINDVFSVWRSPSYSPRLRHVRVAALSSPVEFDGERGKDCCESE